MPRKKKAKKPVKPKFPKRLYVSYTRNKTTGEYYPDDFQCEESMDTMKGGWPTGEYILAQKGTTRTILEVEEED